MSAVDKLEDDALGLAGFAVLLILAAAAYMLYRGYKGAPDLQGLWNRFKNWLSESEDLAAKKLKEAMDAALDHLYDLNHRSSGDTAESGPDWVKTGTDIGMGTDQTIPNEAMQQD